MQFKGSLPLWVWLTFGLMALGILVYIVAVGLTEYIMDKVI